jgi:hypothetical protein
MMNVNSSRQTFMDNTIVKEELRNSSQMYLQGELPVHGTIPSVQEYQAPVSPILDLHL